MSTEQIALFTQELIDASALNIVAGEELEVLSSQVINNGSGTVYNSLRLEVDYVGLTPSSGQFFIGVLVEAENDAGDYVPVAYQFTPIRSANQAQKRIIVLQPDMDTFNLGIDDIVFPVDREEARISRQQGFLPESNIRVRVLLKDNDPAGATAFSSVTVTAAVELYNV